MKEVEEYKHMGRLLTPGNEMTSVTDVRIPSVWKRFRKFRDFLRQRRVPVYLKKKVIDTVTLPAMTYGEETWSLAINQRNKLKKT